MINRWRMMLLLLAIVGVAFTIGWFTRGATTVTAVARPPREIRIDDPNQKYINPILFYEASSSTEPDFIKIKGLFNDLIEQKKEDGLAESVSVYFRDLNTGRWTGTNISEKYEPSSMLKVSVMMAYLRHAIENPSILSQELYYRRAATTSQYYAPNIQLKTGYHTVQDLIKSMIISSDNTAAGVLVENDPEYTSNIYKQFRLPEPPKDMTDYAGADFMSVRSFVPVFRVLYNSTYLPENLSEQALELLSLTDFKKGLNAGVPSAITVAHKFGERTNQLADGRLINRELHDCGIIYYPGKPYLLCIMTRGQQFPDLEKTISDISKLVYDYVQKTGI